MKLKGTGIRVCNPVEIEVLQEIKRNFHRLTQLQISRGQKLIQPIWKNVFKIALHEIFMSETRQNDI